MKKLLLAAVMLVAGMVVSENVSAQLSGQKSEKDIRVPAEIKAAFKMDKAYIQTDVYARVRPEVWTVSKGLFIATYEVYYIGEYAGTYSSSYLGA